MDFMFDWENENDRFSFEDSERFEEDSLCSWISEPESLCNNWRGWKRQNGGQATNNKQQAGAVSSLVELASKAVACHIPFEVVEHFPQPIPEQIQLRIAFWSFPENEEDIRLYSCLANGSADEFQKGEHLYKTKSVKEVLQIGFHLSASVIPPQGIQQAKGNFNVAVVFDRRRISSCTCTCNSQPSWCSHVVALCLYRIHQAPSVKLRAPVSESLSRLHRDQLQKFAQYLISELPQQILPTAQRLLDELLSSQENAMNTVYGAPDPTAGPSANEQTSWCLDESALHENVKKTLVKFCVPSPIVFSSVIIRITLGMHGHHVLPFLLNTTQRTLVHKKYLSTHFVLTMENDLISSDEEDALDLLLQDALDDDPSDPAFSIDDMELASQSSVGSSQISSASDDPLANPNMHWKDADIEDTGVPDPRTVTFHPERQPGLQLGRILRYGARQFREPFDFLKLFLTESLVFSFCVATNNYAEMLISRGERSSYASQGSWTPLTVEEFYRFIGIILYMSVVKFQTLDRYWSTDVLYRSNPVPGIMSRRRFQAILSFLQVTPPADINKAEKLTRIQSLVDHVREKSKELYQPHREIAVDERMVASKHKFSGIRQFIKDKPVRFGIKLWVMACNMSGYTYDFFVYLGMFTDRTKGIGYNVTFRLCESLFDQGYRLFTDCFYTSLALGKDLLARKVYLVGVLKSNSLSLPDELKNVKIWERVARRGDFRWHRVDEFVFVQWKDCKVVTFMSPLHQGSATTVCERTMKSRLTWNKKELVQPVVAKDYNKCMGAVDLSNQFTNKYPSYIRTQYHWWKVLFFHLLDIMIVNSYILFQEFRKTHENQFTDCSPGFGQLEFRESLALSLMCLNEKSVSTESVIKCIPEFLDKRKDCTFCNAEAIFMKKKSPSYKTSVFCPSCQVPLCLSNDRNCFKKWHSKEGEDIRKCADVSCKKRKL